MVVRTPLSTRGDKLLTSDRQEFLHRVHERPKKYLQEWIAVPAHIHHNAYRMSDPPTQRPQSRIEFQQLLQCLEVPDADSEVSEKFGYGVLHAASGDRLILVWEAHTEYYSYQVWHIPHESTASLDFGPLTFPEFQFPFCPLGTRVNALDILIRPVSTPPTAELRANMPGRHIYASRIFGKDISVVTSFTPDAHTRERYVVFSTFSEALLQQLSQLVDTIANLENYYHLILLPFPEFSQAVDQIHDFEQRHLKQRQLITAQLNKSTSETLVHWVTVLTEDFMKVSRLAEAMRYKLAAAAPYDAIVRANLQAFQERPLSPFRPLSSYVLGRISGVADGYHQFLRRIDALQTDFEATIAVIRTRVYLLLQDQNVNLLTSVDKTTKSQAILQHTVEGLSVIVISYYLTGLANYIFKALQGLAWIRNADFATALFVPVSIALSLASIMVGRRIINKRYFSNPDR